MLGRERGRVNKDTNDGERELSMFGIQISGGTEMGLKGPKPRL